MDHPLFLAVALAAIALEIGRLVAAVLRPTPAYDIRVEAGGGVASDAFTALLARALAVPIASCRDFEVLANGREFYGGTLESILRARSSIHLVAYIFTPGGVTRRIVRAMAERARAGVEVRVVLDAFGSLTTRRSFFDELIRAGGRVEWYHPLNWHTWPRVNHRTHQEILVIDGETALVGGPGFADYWLTGGRRLPTPWRDTMCRLRGEAVAGLQAAFADNWLEVCGEMLVGERYYPPPADPGIVPTLVVNSAPTRGGSASSRMLFQILVHAARERIEIATPYFLPDATARRELVRAMRERGVEVRILVPGRHSVPFFTRRCSRRRYGELLRGGAKIFEYLPAMMHVKAMVVDGEWSVVGSTNFDPRSFGINDEFNVAVRDRAIAARLVQDFEYDLDQAEPIDYDRWRRRPWWERATELLSAIFERQQ